MKKISIRHLNLPVTGSGRFKIRKVEVIMGQQDLVQDVHRHDFFFLLAIKKGKGHHEIDFTPYPVADHSVFFLRPGQVHRLQLKTGTTGYLVEFDEGFYRPRDKSFSQRLRKTSHKNFCTLDVKRFDRLLTLLSSMLEEYTKQEEGYVDAIQSNLGIFFIELIRQSPDPTAHARAVNSYNQDRLEEFLAFLDKHIVTHKSVSDYTRLMNLSAYQLNEITKSLMNKTASELINEHIILEAKRNLLATNNQVKDIADHLGYEDPSYFTRVFKKHTGLSPETFRQNFR